MIGGKLNKRITLLRGKVRVIVANIKEVINKELMIKLQIPQSQEESNIIHIKWRKSQSNMLIQVPLMELFKINISKGEEHVIPKDSMCP